MNTKIYIIIFIFMSFSSHAMLHKLRTRGRLQLHDHQRIMPVSFSEHAPQKKLEIFVPILSLDLCTFVQQPYCNILALSKTCSSLSDAAKTVNALAQTNKFLNVLINDNARTLALIKDLSYHFNCSNMDVAHVLGTKEANIRYLLQKSLLANWTGGDRTVKSFSKLKSMGVDVNFTSSRTTPLYQNVRWEEIGYAQVGKWLIENGADINFVDKDGRNIFMCALEKNNEYLIPLLLHHNSLKIDHQDNQGNTSLHYCIKVLGYLAPAITHHIRESIDHLLKKGANRAIKNKEDKTPLDLCLTYEINYYDPIIKLLKGTK